MRSIKVAFAALALSAATTAFAAASSVNHIMQINNDIGDTIAVSQGVTISITALGVAATNSTTTLAYSTHSDENAGTAATSRKVTVSSSALPSGVTGTVAFTADSLKGAGSTQALGTVADLVTGIPQFITQTAAALTYSFTATKGFDSAPITVTYTLVDE